MDTAAFTYVKKQSHIFNNENLDQGFKNTFQLKYLIENFIDNLMEILI